MESDPLWIPGCSEPSSEAFGQERDQDQEPVNLESLMELDFNDFIQVEDLPALNQVSSEDFGSLHLSQSEENDSGSEVKEEVTKPERRSCPSVLFAGEGETKFREKMQKSSCKQTRKVRRKRLPRSPECDMDPLSCSNNNNEDDKDSKKVASRKLSRSASKSEQRKSTKVSRRYDLDPDWSELLEKRSSGKKARALPRRLFVDNESTASSSVKKLTPLKVRKLEAQSWKVLSPAPKSLDPVPSELLDQEISEDAESVVKVESVTAPATRARVSGRRVPKKNPPRRRPGVRGTKPLKALRVVLEKKKSSDWKTMDHSRLSISRIGDAEKKPEALDETLSTRTYGEEPFQSTVEPSVEQGCQSQSDEVADLPDENKILSESSNKLRERTSGIHDVSQETMDQLETSLNEVLKISGTPDEEEKQSVLSKKRFAEKVCVFKDLTKSPKSLMGPPPSPFPFIQWYSCACGFINKKYDHLVDHIGMFHPEWKPTQICCVCRSSFWHPAALNQHLADQHKATPPIECEACKKFIAFDMDALEHHKMKQCKSANILLCLKKIPENVFPIAEEYL